MTSPEPGFSEPSAVELEPAPGSGLPAEAAGFNQRFAAPRGASFRTVLTTVSRSSQIAAGVALERGRGQRLGRLVEVVSDRVQERWRPRRGTVRGLVVRPGARLTWRDLPAPPPPRPLAAVVAPLAVATCDLDRPLALGATPFPLPLHLGHECVAEVVRVGEEVRSVVPGDRVVVPFQISCGSCPACRVGYTGNCRSVPPLSMYGFGFAGGLWGGAIADRLTVPYADSMLVQLPVGVRPAAAASAADTLSDAYRHIAPHVEHIKNHPEGPRVVILGAVHPRSRFSASVPLYAGLIARALVPEVQVLVVDARPLVRQHAERLGLAAAPVGELRRQRAPLVVDCSASSRGLARAIQATAPDGYCSCAGSLHATVRVPAALMFGRNATLSISRSHVRSVIPAVLGLIASGQLQPELVTTAYGPYEDAPDVLRAHLLGADIKSVLLRDNA